MNKIKLLFDMEQLSVDGLKGTGIVRVGNVLFERLLSNKQIDLYPIITTSRGDPLKYLKAKGFYDQVKNKLVYMP